MAGWEQRILLTGDRHHDNLHADHRMELKHLEKAREYSTSATSSVSCRASTTRASRIPTCVLSWLTARTWTG
jgi:hypothetical protein